APAGRAGFGGRRGNARVAVVERGEEARRDLLTLVPPVAALQQVGRGGQRAHVRQGHRPWQRRSVALELLHLPVHCLPLLALVWLHALGDFRAADVYLLADEVGDLLLPGRPLLGGGFINVLVLLRKPGLALNGEPLAGRLLQLAHALAEVGGLVLPHLQLLAV